MNEFARIIAEDVLVFAYCSEDQIDEAFSVAQLERISQQLRSSGVDAIARFIQTVRVMQEEAGAQGLDERFEQLASMPDHLGLES
jgi:hypothetical protein